MNIIETLLSDVEWRVSELSSIRGLPHRYKFNAYDLSFLRRQSIVSIYAIWEGFIKNCSEEYLKYINILELGFNAVDINFKSYYFNSKISLEQSRPSKKAQDKFISIAQNVFNTHITFEINEALLRNITSSNVNYKQLCKILQNFCLSSSELTKYEDLLNKLLNFRNKIAHGENAITVDETEISDFIHTIENLMYDCLIEFENKINNFTNCSYASHI